MAQEKLFTKTRVSLGEAEKKQWLRLVRSKNIGSKTLWRLLEGYKTASTVIEQLPFLSSSGERGFGRNVMLASEASIEKEWKAGKKNGVKFLAACEPDYPPALASIEDAPGVLCVLGNLSVFLKHSISIVGSRNASLPGRHMARRIAADLAEENFVITSGLALGIDTEAHRGALEKGTIGVLAGGVDVVYPPQNKDLYQDILRHGGTMVSENPLGTKPLHRAFPTRNRIIAALSLATVVVEAQKKSGSIITAERAGHYGRLVGAVPGFPLEPRASGTNTLLKDGALLVESAQDILQELSYDKHDLSVYEKEETTPTPPTFTPPPPPQEQTIQEMEQEVLGLLSIGVETSVDELIEQLKAETAVLQIAVARLEIGGRIENRPGNKILLIPRQAT